MSIDLASSSCSLRRKILTVSLLSALAAPAAWAGDVCQLAGKPDGGGATAVGDGSLACGEAARAAGAGAVAVGSWTDLNGNGVVDAGEVTLASAQGAVAIGPAAQALSLNSVAIGHRAIAVPSGAVAIGQSSAVTSMETVSTYTVVNEERSDETIISEGPASGNFEGGVAIGRNNRSNGSRNIVLGDGAIAEKVSNTATIDDSGAELVTTYRTTRGPQINSIAIGTNAIASGDDAIVIGTGAQAYHVVGEVMRGQKNNYAVYSVAPTVNSIVIGKEAVSRGSNNVVIGGGAQTTGDTILMLRDELGIPILDENGFEQFLPIARDENSTIIGVDSSAVQGWGSAFGHRASAYGRMSTALGVYSFAVGQGSTAVGGYLDWSASLGSPVGPNPGGGIYGRSIALGIGSQSFGSAAYTWGNYDTAVGPAAATGDRSFLTPEFIGNSVDEKVVNGSTAVGFRAQAEGRSSTAVGLRSFAALEYAVAVGADSAAGAYASAFGHNSEAVGLHSFAAGSSSLAAWHETIAIGYQSIAGVTEDDTSTRAIAIGASASAKGGNSSAIGALAQASSVSSVAVGSESQAVAGYATAVGSAARAEGEYGLALGANAFAIGNGSSALGHNAFSAGADSVAIGSYAIAEGSRSVTLGANANAVAENSVAIGASSHAHRANTVSIGAAGAERQLTNVAEGQQDTDAVNLAQLKRVSDGLSGVAARAVTYDSDDKSVLTLSGQGGTRIQNVSDGSVSAGSTDAVNGRQLFNASQGLANALGGGAAFNAQGVLMAPSYTVQGAQFSDVGSTIAALDVQIGQIRRRLSDGGGGDHRGIAIDGNGAANAAQGTKSVAIGDNASALAPSGVAIGAGSVAAAQGGVVIGTEAKATSQAPNATVIGEKASVSAANSTALGRGASASASNSVALGAGSVADRANTVSVGAAGAERQLTNVAAGTRDTDGANVAQLKAGISESKAYTNSTATQTLKSANSYTDATFKALNDRFSGAMKDVDDRFANVDKRIDRMAAMSGAYAGMAMNTAGLSGLNRIGVGVGGQGGEQALAVGYQRAIGSRASISFGGAISGDEKSLMGGAGFSW